MGAVFIFSSLDHSKYFEPAPWEIKRVRKKYTQALHILYRLVYPTGIQGTVRQSLDQVYLRAQSWIGSLPFEQLHTTAFRRRSVVLSYCFVIFQELPLSFVTIVCSLGWEKHSLK